MRHDGFLVIFSRTPTMFQSETGFNTTNSQEKYGLEETDHSNQTSYIRTSQILSL